MSELQDEAKAESIEPHPSRSSVAKERGIALIMVIACLAIIFPFVTEFGYRARVDWQAAVNQGDEIRARNVQRGALRLSVLMFELQRMIFNKSMVRDNFGVFDVTQFAPYLMSVFGSADGAAGIGALAGVNTNGLPDLSLGPGYEFEVRVEAESGRINVNCLADVGAAGDRKKGQPRMVQAINSVMSPVLYDSLFDEEKSNGQRYRREDVLGAIVDYIDDDRARYEVERLGSSGGAETQLYTQLYDPYQARNARIDSLLELHLAEGVDDDWMTAFSPYLTTYGDCKVNLNFAGPELIAIVIANTAAPDEVWKVEGENYHRIVRRLANFVVQSREFNLFKDQQAFVELVERPDAMMNPLAAMMGSDAQANAEQEMREQAQYVPDGISLNHAGSKKEEGDKKDKDEDLVMLEDIATVAPERTYRIEITANVGAVRRRLTAVYDMNYVRNRRPGKGAWLHVREE